LIGREYKIYDETGTILFNETINSENTRIDLDKLSRGIYFLMINENTNTESQVIKIAKD
jgi:hypothetical protein